MKISSLLFDIIPKHYFISIRYSFAPELSKYLNPSAIHSLSHYRPRVSPSPSLITDLSSSKLSEKQPIRTPSNALPFPKTYRSSRLGLRAPPLVIEEIITQLGNLWRHSELFSGSSYPLWFFAKRIEECVNIYLPPNMQQILSPIYTEARWGCEILIGVCNWGRTHCSLEKRGERYID